MLATALPLEFINSIKLDSPFGKLLLDALDTPSPTSIRLNPRKIVLTHLDLSSPVTWCEHGYYLNERPVFTLDPLYHAGVYYAQEAASMMLTSLIKQLDLPENAFVLDACASPGGKTTAMVDGLSKHATVLANEINRHRANILAENISKWGVDNVLVTNDSPEAFKQLTALFDVVLIDAPCSGEGMFRKDPNARYEWTPEAPELCATRQELILEQLHHAIKPGGYLIYSTCTFNRLENEQQMKAMLATGAFEQVQWNHPNQCQTGRDGLGCYFLPGYTKSEGLYLCVLQKKGELEAYHGEISGQLQMDDVFGITLKENQCMIKQGEWLYVLTRNAKVQLDQIKTPIRYLKKGVKVAEHSPKGWVPNHELALSTSIDHTIPRIALTEREALQYLRGETFLIQQAAPGYYCVTFQETPLGLIKHLGNRFNNLYPKEWRIRMQLS